MLNFILKQLYRFPVWIAKERDPNQKTKKKNWCSKTRVKGAPRKTGKRGSGGEGGGRKRAGRRKK